MRRAQQRKRFNYSIRYALTLCDQNRYAASPSPIASHILLFQNFVSIIGVDSLKQDLARVHPHPPPDGCDRLPPRVEYDSPRVKQGGSALPASTTTGIIDGTA